MRLLSLTLLLLLAPLSSARAAEDSSWSATFASDALGTWLDSAPARYLLVPAGPPEPALAQAEQALAAALRASGKATLVMNAQALGPVASLDDASIVQRGAGFPVDRVLVLRLFPEASGELTQAVATLYDTAGKSRGAFSATRGTPLAPQGPPAESQQAATPEPVAPPPPPSTSELSAREQYEQQYIGFEEVIAVNTKNLNAVARMALPYEGKFKKPLEGDAFYKKVGREDLVKAYQSKRSTKIALGVLGGAVALGGGIYAANQTSVETEDCFLGTDFNGTSACFDRNRARHDAARSRFATGLGLSVAGLGLLTVGILLNAHPITPSEARELADGYNKKLASDLGLGPDAPPPPPAERPAAFQARLSPVLGAGGAGLLLSGTF